MNRCGEGLEFARKPTHCLQVEVHGTEIDPVEGDLDAAPLKVLFRNERAGLIALESGELAGGSS